MYKIKGSLDISSLFATLIIEAGVLGKEEAAKHIDSPVDDYDSLCLMDALLGGLRRGYSISDVFVNHLITISCRMLTVP